MVKKRRVSKAAKIAAKPKRQFVWQYVPLKGSFMVLAMLGFLISAYLVYPQSMTYGIAFMLLFTIMFIAAIISMTKAPLVE